ncbi:MAG: tRNA (adenosine(37)-N6)-dimethylallyltransferase MiaA [Bacteroidota bacterium]
MSKDHRKYLNQKPLLVSIVGPTATGKTTLSIRVAKRFETEIVSVDSRQFYREMHIGTAKPNSKELKEVKHHFIDSHSILNLYSAGEYGRDAIEKIKQLHKRNAMVIAVGGSTLYLKAIWEGFDEMPKIYPSIRETLNNEIKEKGLSALLDELKETDPEYYQAVDRNNGQRVIRALEITRGTGKSFTSFRKNVKTEMPYNNLKIGLEQNRLLLFQRINRRVDNMIQAGLFEEASALIRYKNHNALQTVGYTEIFDHLEGKYDKKETIRLLKRNSRRYAKRQMTWFKRYDDIHWFHPHEEDEIVKLIEKSLSGE